MNVNWNGTAFAGNPIPPNKNIPESIDTNSYNSAFTGDHNNQEYNSHFETTTDASISSSKSSPDATRNQVRKQNQFYILKPSECSILSFGISILIAPYDYFRIIPKKIFPLLTWLNRNIYLQQIM